MTFFIVTLVRTDRARKTLRWIQADDIDQAVAEAVRRLRDDGWFVGAVRQDEIDFLDLPFAEERGLSWLPAQ